MTGPKVPSHWDPSTLPFELPITDREDDNWFN